MKPRHNETLLLALKTLAPTLWLAVYGLIVYHWAGGSGSDIAESGPKFLIAIGSLCGLTGAYLALTQLILQSRIPLIEWPFGRASLVHLHRINGYAVITALILHADLVTMGYAWSNETDIIQQALAFATNYPYVIWAMAALTIFITIVILSVTIVRRRLRYETWYFAHIFTYLAILLAFNHQLAVGIDFASAADAFMRQVWWGLYIFTFGSIIIFRILRPVITSLWYNLRVDRIQREADNIYSVYIGGRNLASLRYDAGQFMIWRFLDRTRWWQSHPFTISLAPGSQHLRLTFKAIGDFTGKLHELRPGTRVIADGPYGDFTAAQSHNPKRLFIAGGIGLTPLRAMIEALPDDHDAVLIYSVRKATDIALKTELDALAASKPLRVHYLVSDEQTPGLEHGILDADTITRLVPDVATRSILLCGPPPMMAAVSGNLQTAGVNKNTIHTERFAF